MLLRSNLGWCSAAEEEATDTAGKASVDVCSCCSFGGWRCSLSRETSTILTQKLWGSPRLSLGCSNSPGISSVWSFNLVDVLDKPLKVVFLKSVVLLLQLECLVVVSLLDVVKDFDALPHIGDSCGVVFVDTECLNLVFDTLVQVLFVHQSLLLLLKSLNLLYLVVHLEELGSVLAKLDGPLDEVCVLTADFIVFVWFVSEHFFLELLESHLDVHDVLVNSVTAIGLSHFPDEFVVVREEQLDISVRRTFCTAETGNKKLNAFN